jgi:hypothetical protein
MAEQIKNQFDYLNLLAPNRKRLRECTFEEMIECGGWFTAVGKASVCACASVRRWYLPRQSHATTPSCAALQTKEKLMFITIIACSLSALAVTSTLQVLRAPAQTPRDKVKKGAALAATIVAAWIILTFVSTMHASCY